MAEDFTFANVRRAAAALGRVLPPRSIVAIGHDHRFLSEEFAHQAGAILAGQKHLVVLLAGPTTSPALSFSLRTLKARAGVMITASHNPFAYNGFKIKVPPGCSAAPAFTRRVEEAVSPEEPPTPADFPHRTFSPDDSYLGFLFSRLDKKFWRSPKASVVADGMFGTGGAFWAKLLSRLRVKGTVIRSGRDPLFGGASPEPVEKNLAPLAAAVRIRRASVGLAVDGDADRIGAVDEEGRYLTPHHVFALILLHLVEGRGLKGRLVQGVSMGYLSERIARASGLEVVEVPVGFKHVAEKIREGKVLWGGEESGGYGVGLWSMERDGLLSGLLLLEMLLARRRPLSALREELESRFGASFFLREDRPARAAVPDKGAWTDSLARRLPGSIDRVPVREVRTLDGLKVVLQDDSWFLLRPSGTEPLIRAYAESPDLKKTRRLLAKAHEIATMGPS